MSLSNSYMSQMYFMTNIHSSEFYYINYIKYIACIIIFTLLLIIARSYKTGRYAFTVLMI